jgi:hypothetical protein
MFKKVLLIILIFFIATNAFSVRLVEPISKELVENDFVGAIVPGQTLELIVSKEFGRFDNLEITSDLPDFFEVKVKDYLESFKILISSSERTPITNYNFSFDLIGNHSKSAQVFFAVEDSLLDVTLLNFSSESFVDEETVYEILFVNRSDADAFFNIKLNLPWHWVGEDFFGKEYYKTVVVPKKSQLRDEIIVFPRIHGNHYFSSEIFLNNSINSKRITLHTKTSPTLNYKIASSLNGFPFYSISLLPNYFLNGLFSQIFS